MLMPFLFGFFALQVPSGLALYWVTMNLFSMSTPNSSGMDPDRIEASYWYGLFLLRKAQHVSVFRAYFVVKKGIDQLKRVRQIIPEYEHGGASRILGLLYTKAPKWSPFGDPAKGIFFAEESTKLDPDYLLNRVRLAEAYQKHGDKKAAIQALHEILVKSPDNNPCVEKARSMLMELE